MGFALKGRQIIHVEVARVYGCPTPNLPLLWRRLAKAEGREYGSEDANPFFEDEDDDEDEYEATTIREGRTVDLKRCHLADM
jgi:hypothetical protein